MNKTVGDLLREARNKKGLALQTIERSTGVATHHLLAIELDQFSLIEPDHFDTYLRAYAESVGLDFAELRRHCDVQTTSSYEEPVLPMTSFDELVAEEQADYVPEVTPARSPRRYSRSERNAQLSGKNKNGKKKSILPTLILSLLLLSGIVFGGYKLYELFLKPSLKQTEGSSSSTSTSTPVSSTPASSVSEQEATSGAQFEITGGGDGLEITVTNAAQPLTVEISKTGDSASWIALTNSDLGEAGTTLSPELPSYTATMFEGTTEGLLTLGVTEGITLKIDGKEVDLSALTTAANSYITIRIQ